MTAAKRAVPTEVEEAPESVTWADLVDVEPRLDDLRTEVASDPDRSWRAYGRWKGELCTLVGWYADDDGLPDWMLTPAAYDVAHDAILGPHW